MSETVSISTFYLRSYMRRFPLEELRFGHTAFNNSTILDQKSINFKAVLALVDFILNIY